MSSDRREFTQYRGQVPDVGLLLFVKNNATDDWKDLAYHLSCDTATISTIDERNRDTKSRCMDMLEEWIKRKGDDATVDVLQKALLDCDLKSIADRIKVEDRPRRSPSARDPSRQDGGQERFSSQVTPFNQGCYKMTSDLRGIALIINNINYAPDIALLSNRKGAEEDLYNVRKICEKLKVRLEIKEDLTAEEMAAVVQDVSERDHSKYDCFVLFLMSHGIEADKETYVVGTDGQLLAVDDIISIFQCCKSLVGKPKLFFIQASRGENIDEGVPYSEPVKTEGSSAAPIQLRASDRGREESRLSPMRVPVTHAAMRRPGAGERKLPKTSDQLVMYSTVRGFHSWRNRKQFQGSYLIKALSEVIVEHADTEDIQSMLTMVNAKVAERDMRFSADEWYKQQPEVTHTLRKKLYFFPYH